MCGIVGYVGKNEVLPVLLKGLEKLEYRGYDSSGVAFLPLEKNKRRILILKEKVRGNKINGHIGIGHTRWATHGEPSERNAHPHQDCGKKFVLVHNGIIENYTELKHWLKAAGHKFSSETDTEVAVHLIEEYYDGNVLEAFRKAIGQMKGFFAFTLISTYEPDTLFVFKRSNPLVIGLGKDENFVASDVPALLPYTNRVIYLSDDEIACVTSEKVEIFPLKGKRSVHHEAVRIQWGVEQAEKGGFPHFMLKEIYEQPQVLETILTARLKRGHVSFDSLDASIEQQLRKVERIHLVSCGTAYHAGLVANYMLGECVRLPIEATVSSEFRYEDPVVTKNDLVILITQSGETADTLAALREAKLKGALTLAVVNVVGSTIAREADCVLYTHAGPEIGVASTKAYIAQLAVLALFSIYLGELRGTLGVRRFRELVAALEKLPGQVKKTLRLESSIKKCAKKLYPQKNFLYLGRGYNFPNALEGALKLKEISYAHAHGYPAGEMKHGPIALVDSEQPVICIAPRSKTYEKMVSNIEEIKARKGIIISISTEGDRTIDKLSTYAFSIPRTEEFLSPLLSVIPLQLLAYHVAVFKKRDVDQPRNLAKSVTVE